MIGQPVDPVDPRLEVCDPDCSIGASRTNSRRTSHSIANPSLDGVAA
jgi:hypothetical protein